jgi:hypothetical protein
VPRLSPLVLLAAIVSAASVSACINGDPPAAEPLPLTRLRADRTYLRDGHGRYVFIHGINTSGADKVPARIDSKGVPSYVGKPFPVDQARAHFAKLRAMGWNSIRLLVMWEGIEPVKRGQHDEAYLDYLREITKAAAENDIYVLFEMHQDIWSRFLHVKYNQTPKYGLPGSLESNLLALVKPYTDVVTGNGAPRWVVEACLQEKNLSSPSWGYPRVLSGLTGKELGIIAKLYLKLTGGDLTVPTPSTEWISTFLLNRPDPFDVNETTDMLPISAWALAHGLSLDVARCYACFFAGDVVFPGLVKEGQNVKDYLQESFAGAWKALATKVKDLPNVMGYDVFNEPSGNYLVLAAVGAAVRAGAVDAARGVLVSVLGDETGQDVYDILLGFRLLPPDSQPETLRLWGLDKIDPLAAIGLFHGFDDNHLRPFYERVGREIQTVDPKAVIYIERSLNVSIFSTLIGAGGGIAGQWDEPMTRPTLPRSDQVVFTPHWYTDIYPFPSFVYTPRSFTAEEVRHRDYQPALEQAKSLAAWSLGNPPVVFGEFGTFYNFGGIEQAKKDNYAVPAHILDNHYEAFERMLQGHIQWNYCPENNEAYGDLWNHEDLSIVDPQGTPRTELTWSRPYAKALAGKPISTNFYSDYHYYDPDKGKQLPRREFEVRYASKETSAPTEIFVPEVQYPDGFYIWISDGFCTYDAKKTTLYHYPSKDEPGVEHWVQIRPPQPRSDNTGWRYFVHGDKTVSGH